MIKKSTDKPVKVTPNTMEFAKLNQENLESLFDNKVLAAIILTSGKNSEDLKNELTKFPLKKTKVAYLQGQIKGINSVLEIFEDYKNKMLKLRSE
jgi:hypothetical protein